MILNIQRNSKHLNWWYPMQEVQDGIFPNCKADPKTVVSIILGGGAGTRLFPLTQTRAKPAVSRLFIYWSHIFLPFWRQIWSLIKFLIINEQQVPLGGCYRLVDVPVSNCINSGINKIYILTQFNSQSLNRHISRTYNLGSEMTFHNGFVEVFVIIFCYSNCNYKVLVFSLT